jgi:hypothetical protein
MRTGLYFRGAIGGSAFAGASGHLDGDNNSADAISISGGAVDLELSIGGSPIPGLAVGAAIYGSNFPSPSFSNSGVSGNGGGALVSSIGPVVDWYFDPSKGFHAEVAFGYAVLQLKASSDGNPVAPGTDFNGNGGSFMAGVGYDWMVGPKWSIGVLGRVQYFSGSVTDSSGTGTKFDVSGAIPGILLAATYY